MAAGKFHHFGVPTTTRYPGTIYIEGAKVHVTDPEKHPYRVEYVRFEPDSPFPQVVKTRAHAAFVVQSVDEAVKGKNVVVAPVDASANLRIAFITDGDAVIELLEMK